MAERREEGDFVIWWSVSNDIMKYLFHYFNLMNILIQANTSFL